MAIEASVVSASPHQHRQSAMKQTMMASTDTNTSPSQKLDRLTIFYAVRLSLQFFKNGPSGSAWEKLRLRVKACEMWMGTLGTYLRFQAIAALSRWREAFRRRPHLSRTLVARSKAHRVAHLGRPLAPASRLGPVYIRSSSEADDQVTIN